MADQSVKITNMPESGSRERVAFDLCKIVLQSTQGSYTKKRILDVYAECLDATFGGRDYDKEAT